MQAERRLLVVVADGEHARFLRTDPVRGLHTSRVLASAAVHQQASDLRTDRPGAAFHSCSSAHHALAPRHDPQVLEKAKFAQTIATELNTAAARGEFQELVLVAPPHILGAVREGLEERAATRVIGALAKDLVKTPESELPAHLTPWIRPARRER